MCGTIADALCRRRTKGSFSLCQTILETMLMTSSGWHSICICLDMNIFYLMVILMVVLAIGDAQDKK